MEINEFFYRNMTYREALLETAIALDSFIYSLHNSIFQITMTGEMKEWSDAVPTNEEHQIPIEVFEACNDRNVSDMLRLLKTVDKKYEWFLNANSISEEDIQEFENMKYTDERYGEEGMQDEEDETNEDNPLPF